MSSPDGMVPNSGAPEERAQACLPFFDLEGTDDLETAWIGFHKTHIPSFLFIHIEHAIGIHHSPF